MLYDRGHHVPALCPDRFGRATDSQIVRLCPARGEQHFVRLTPEELRDLPPGALDCFLSAVAVDMARRGIAEVLPQERQHRLHYLRVDGGRGVVVEVDRTLSSFAHDAEVTPRVSGLGETRAPRLPTPASSRKAPAPRPAHYDLA